MTHGRTKAGTFAPGNSGGPGRPRRDTEREYLTVLSDACPLDAWRKIVEKAVEDAQRGDTSARAWLTTFVVGRPEKVAPSLHKLAVWDAGGQDPFEMELMLDGVFPPRH